MSFIKLLSSSLLLWSLLVVQATAHEVLPSIADMTRTEEGLVFDVELNVESFVSGIDQSVTTDTNDAAEAKDYDTLRALEPAALEAAFREYWPQMEEGLSIIVDGTEVSSSLTAVEIDEVGNFDLPRQSRIQFVADIADDAQSVSVGWAPEFGALVLRQMGVEAPFDDFLAAGASTPEFSLAGGDQATGWQTFFNYIPVGFDHIIPKGLDHILFVLGLFFLSTRMRPLLWQITAFTLAHTITLALAALGYVNIPGSIVEPLIAASIVYVAVENLYTDGLSRWRPAIIFGFGLLHGLGFASVLAEFGLPEGSFIPALIGFNIGVEIGQLAVVAVAYLCVRKAIDFDRTGEASPLISGMYLAAAAAVMVLLIPATGMIDPVEVSILIVTVAILLGLCAASVVVGRFDSYREIVAMPGSILIATVAMYWCIERVFL